MAFIVLAALNTAALFESFNYVDAVQMRGWLEQKRPILIVDIQVKDEFAAHHLRGSHGTGAYPVKSDEERRSLDGAVNHFKAHPDEDVVVVCPRGKGGAKRAYAYLKKSGVPEENLFILTGGMAKWPYAEWVEKGK